MQAIDEVLTSGDFAGGRFVQQFEEDFAAYCGKRYAVGVGSGTEALRLTLIALGIGPGDEVITVPMTFAATVEAIHHTGARPVFVDIDERTFTMDPGALAQAVTRRTKAIVPVHLYGQMANMVQINDVAHCHGLNVVEDAAQAHGAKHLGQRAGTFGIAGCFSFYPSKNLGAIGDAGAVVTDNGTIAHKLRVLRNHGSINKYKHAVPGWNSRMDGIQAAILRVRLRDLDNDNRARRDHAATYTHHFAASRHVIFPEVATCNEHVFHIYAVRARRRHALIQNLRDGEIGFGIHYPVPVHLQPAFKHLGHKPGDFPVAERCAAEFVSLPIYPDLTTSQISRVVASVTSSAPSCAE